ncbi:MAG TPA: DUF4199 domain-containing protein [Gemmatimonadaceae bacterium]|nr:DUF4199 domain-containing protein [Gemmatimonadaceae bacterium]
MSGALISVMMVLTIPFHDQIGFETTGLVVGYTTMVLAFVLIYFGVRSYRDTIGGGTVRFGRALAIGVLIAAVSSLCYVATWEVMYYKFMPDFMDKYSAHEVTKARASGASEEQIATRKAEMDKFAVMYQNPLYNAAFTIMEPLPVGLIIALISAGVLSRRRKGEADANVLAGAPGVLT